MSVVSCRSGRPGYGYLPEVRHRRSRLQRKAVCDAAPGLLATAEKPRPTEPRGPGGLTGDGHPGTQGRLGRKEAGGNKGHGTEQARTNAPVRLAQRAGVV
ncbi:protein of unknown function [Nitrospira japonica]|uniref:Uncharacterized protein n=1 Tax=Nitrospira japonica TaxID=1325564 RepID=A0A1W1I881_9BACT|nr:protein of unknown function [Nitrospira japonica]